MTNQDEQMAEYIAPAAIAAYSQIVVTSDVFAGAEDSSFECDCGESDCIQQ